MDVRQLDQWFSSESRQAIVAQLVKRVGLTRIRAEYFVRLWIYLAVKQQQQPLPLLELKPISTPVACSMREIAELFYHDQEQGSDRSAGMILHKLVALGLIQKSFDGNNSQITIPPLPELFNPPTALAEVVIEAFDPRCDAIPVANLLAQNYNWMNRNKDAVPHRIMQLLRQWGNQYNGGMRVLRRCDNGNPVGFYIMYPTAKASEANFFTSPSQGSHLSSMAAIDPFVMAQVGDLDCVSLFIRSWMIEPLYLDSYQRAFLQDAQQTIRRMQHDFPNLCDLHTLIIHPSYEEMAAALGFQKTIQDNKLSIYWMYLAVDRFLALSFTDS
jgi:hypothetical protein